MLLLHPCQSVRAWLNSALTGLQLGPGLVRSTSQMCHTCKRRGATTYANLYGQLTTLCTYPTDTVSLTTKPRACFGAKTFTTIKVPK